MIGVGRVPALPSDFLPPTARLRQISKTLAAQGHLTGGGRPTRRLRCRRCWEAD